MKVGIVIPYTKKIQNMSIMWDTPWVLLISAFFTENYYFQVEKYYTKK